MAPRILDFKTMVKSYMNFVRPRIHDVIGDFFMWLAFLNFAHFVLSSLYFSLFLEFDLWLGHPNEAGPSRPNLSPGTKVLLKDSFRNWRKTSPSWIPIQK